MKMMALDHNDECESDGEGCVGNLPWVGGDDIRPTTGGEVFGHVLTCSKHSLVMLPGTCSGIPVVFLGEEVMVRGVKSYRVIAMSIEHGMTEAFKFGYADGTPLPVQHAAELN